MFQKKQKTKQRITRFEYYLLEGFTQEEAELLVKNPIALKTDKKEDYEVYVNRVSKVVEALNPLKGSLSHEALEEVELNAREKRVLERLNGRPENIFALGMLGGATLVEFTYLLLRGINFFRYLLSFQLKAAVLEVAKFLMDVLKLGLFSVGMLMMGIAAIKTYQYILYRKEKRTIIDIAVKYVDWREN
jgi:hypothetical protein